MNTNPKAKRILIFGDSITWGRIANRTERFDIQTRYTGVCQSLLGYKFEVIEEGLRGRMAVGLPEYPEKDGYEQFGPIFESHLPVDLVVILLGTNDTNDFANKSVEDIVIDLQKYITIINELAEVNSFKIPKILFITPPKINPANLKKETVFSKASKKTEEIPELLAKMCNSNHVEFLNIQDKVDPCKEDGVHLNIENNKVLGELVANKVKQIDL